MKSRRERRAEARENGVAFEPQYKGRVISQAEYDQEVKDHKEFLENLRKNKFAKPSTEEEVVAEK